MAAMLEVERRTNSTLPVESLIALTRLRHERRLDIGALARAIQRDEASARKTVERLVEAGLAEAHGVKKGRTYTLAAKLYREADQGADYVRQAGFDVIQQEQMVLRYIRSHGRITRKSVGELCRLSEDQASRLLRKLAGERKIKSDGRGRGTGYLPA